MEGIDLGGASSGPAGALTTARSLDRPRGEVQAGLEEFETRCAQLESAVERVFATFGPVLGPLAEPESAAVAPLELKVPASTQVGSALLSSNERIGRLIAQLHTACEACRL
jgi:hypothetical protein